MQGGPGKGLSFLTPDGREAEVTVGKERRGPHRRSAPGAPHLDRCEPFALGPSAQRPAGSGHSTDPTRLHIPVCPTMAQRMGPSGPACGWTAPA